MFGIYTPNFQPQFVTVRQRHEEMSNKRSRFHTRKTGSQPQDKSACVYVYEECAFPPLKQKGYQESVVFEGLPLQIHLITVIRDTYMVCEFEREKVFPCFLCVLYVCGSVYGVCLCE